MTDLLKNKRRILLPALIILAATLIVCGVKRQGKDRVVAKIGEFKITYQDLADQFKSQQGDSAFARADQAARRRLLDGMIDEQITLFEAYRLGIDRDPAVLAVTREKEREIAAYALRKREIDDQIVTEEVLKRFTQWSDRDLYLDYIKFWAGDTETGKNKAIDKADKILDQLRHGAAFKKMAYLYSEHGNAKVDSGRIGWVGCFDSQEAFFSQAYPLKAGEVTKPFFWDNSIWLIKVENIRLKAPVQSAKEKAQVLSRVQDLYSSRLAARANEFNNALLKEFHYTLVADAFDFFCQRCKRMKVLADTSTLFSPQEKEKILCYTDVESTYVGPFFSKAAPYYWRSLDESRVVEMLLSSLHMSRLAKHKAMLLHINELPSVKRDYEGWLVYYLKSVVTQKEVVDKIDVSDAVLHSMYNHERNELVVKPQATVREIFCKTREEMEAVYQKAHRGENFAALQAKYSQNQEDRNNGLIGPFPPGPNGKLGEQAFSGIKIGEISKPFRYRGGWSIIQLLALAPQKYESFEEAKPKLKAEYIDGHRQQAITSWLNQARMNYRIDIDI